MTESYNTLNGLMVTYGLLLSHCDSRQLPNYQVASSPYQMIDDGEMIASVDILCCALLLP
jgi:hypothetical protein